MRHQKRVKKQAAAIQQRWNVQYVCVLVCLCVWLYTIYVIYTVYAFLFVAFTFAEEMNLRRDNKKPYKHGVHTFVYCGMLNEMSKYFVDGMQSFDGDADSKSRILANKNRRHNKCSRILPFTSVCYTHLPIKYSHGGRNSFRISTGAHKHAWMERGREENLVQQSIYYNNNGNERLERERNNKDASKRVNIAINSKFI